MYIIYKLDFIPTNKSYIGYSNNKEGTADKAKYIIYKFLAVAYGTDRGEMAEDFMRHNAKYEDLVFSILDETETETEAKESKEEYIKLINPVYNKSTIFQQEPRDQTPEKADGR